MQNSQLSKRLDSLDILRGLDIFFLVALEPLFIWIISKTALAQTAVGGFLKRSFRTAAWEGFSFYDVIMPLFLFMTGAAIPFSLRKYDTSFKSYLRFSGAFCFFSFWEWLCRAACCRSTSTGSGFTRTRFKQSARAIS